MTYAVSILALVALFTVATVTPVNMGVLAFAAAFIVGGWVSHMALDDIVGFFPGNLFLIVVGITLLFGIARVNGTIDLVVKALLTLVRGKRWAIVWVMFGLAGTLMALGSVMAVGMLAPIAMPIAKKYKIDPLLMGMMISHGALGTAFSPITVYGAFTTGWLADTGLPTNPTALFFIPLALNVFLALVLFFTRGRDLLRKDGGTIDGPVEADADTTTDPGSAAGGTRTDQLGTVPSGSAGGGAVAAPAAVVVSPPVRANDAEGETPGLTPIRILTLLGMLGLLLSAAVFGVDVGIGSMCISAVLLMAAPNRHKAAMNNVSWSVVVLVCGMLTYMSVLEENGTLQFLGDAAASLGSPLLTALLLCLAVGIISAIGSSIGTLGIVFPLAAPMLLAGELGVIGFVAAIAFCTVVVDVSPFSSNGAIVLANAQVADRNAFQQRLLRYCLMIVVVAPVLAFLTVILPTA
ncbi:C4-dicarboxylate ABC transporter [Pseudonocardia sp. C8]|uniref:SLC13 family permease n=1 Tax=Pseudonocardia sp. C8 TaxID=2762759 RepID=UPI00164267B2|nr:SLC13 family permease [Pseudonocardia sp. C8]MBC3191861.1 C4-dicarboxylate ABC transporter [Pseudonocardia sp. C8]